MTEDIFFSESSSQHVEWKINNFFCRLGNYAMDSPSFSLSGINFRLRLEHYYYDVGKIYCGCIFLYLFRERTANESICDYKIGIRNDYIYKVSNSGIRSEYFTIPERSYGYREPVHIDKRKLSIYREILVPEDTLTVFCIVRIHNVRILSSNEKDEPLTLLTLFNEISRTPSTYDDANFSNDLKDLYRSKLFTDVTVNVKGREFLTHRNILALHSPVFAAMFQHNMKEEQSGRVNISDCDPECFEDFLLFMYSGKLDNVTSSNAKSLFMISHKYDVQELLKECIRCIIKTLTADTFCEVLQLAVMFNEPKLMKAVKCFFFKNTKIILMNPNWCTFVLENYLLVNEIFL